MTDSIVVSLRTEVHFLTLWWISVLLSDELYIFDAGTLQFRFSNCKCENFLWVLMNDAIYSIHVHMLMCSISYFSSQQLHMMNFSLEKSWPKKKKVFPNPNPNDRYKLSLPYCNSPQDAVVPSSRRRMQSAYAPIRTLKLRALNELQMNGSQHRIYIPASIIAVTSCINMRIRQNYLFIKDGRNGCRWTKCKWFT